MRFAFKYPSLRYENVQNQYVYLHPVSNGLGHGENS